MRQATEWPKRAGQEAAGPLCAALPPHRTLPHRVEQYIAEEQRVHCEPLLSWKQLHRHLPIPQRIPRLVTHRIPQDLRIPQDFYRAAAGAAVEAQAVAGEGGRDARG